MVNKFQNIQIESELLGLILIDNQIINKVRGYLSVDDFFDLKNAAIYQAILNIASEGLDIEIPLVIRELEQHNAFNKTNESKIVYLSNLINVAGLKTNVEKYIREIANHSQRRKIKQTIKELNFTIEQSNQDPDEIIETFQQKVADSRALRFKEFEDAPTIVDQAIYEIEQKAGGHTISGISSDFPSLDEMTLGFQKGDLIIIAARPSMGKTAFALNLSTNIAKNKTVGLFSLEMSSIQLFNRILASFSFIPGNKIRHPKNLSTLEMKKLYVATRNIKGLNLYVDDSPGLKLSDLVWKARRLHKTKKLDLLVIDYLQLISINTRLSENRQIEVAIISSTLKKLARELEIPIIALSQLSRRVEQRESKIPMMSDLRESGSIEQDADLIMFLYREAYYKKDETSNSNIQSTDIIVAKHRNGATGDITLSFNPSFSLFTDKKG